MSHFVVAGTVDISNLTVSGTQMLVQAPLTLSNLTTTQPVIITDPTPGNNSSGALYLPNGGIGVGSDSYLGGNLTIQGSTEIVGALNAGTVNVNGSLSANTLNVNTINANTVAGNTVLSASYTNILYNGSDANTWFGANAMKTYAQGTAQQAQNNTAMGTSCMADLSFGFNNTAVGFNALQSLVDGSNNTAIGTNALQNHTSSNNNTAIGSGCMTSMNDPDASNNVAIGFNSLYSATAGIQNTCIGAQSAYNYNPSSTTGNITAVGFQAGYNETTGQNNTYVGAFADTSGSYTNSTAIGYGAKTTNNNQIMLGTQYEYVQIPGSLKVQGNVDISGNLSVGPTGQIYGNVQPFSDARLKEEAMPLPTVLPIFPLLRPRRFRWKETQKEDIGFLAQEFYESIGPELWPNDMIHTAPNGYLTLDYAKMVVVLTKAVQELKEKIDQTREEVKQTKISIQSNR